MHDAPAPAVRVRARRRRYAMTARVHRVLVTLGSFFAGLSGVWQLSEVQPLGIPEEVPAVTALIAAIVMLAANVWRANWPIEDDRA